MLKEEFHIGQDFFTASGHWRCTDIGTRVIIAIQLNQEDSRNYYGPPYLIPETVFDEYDMEGCSLNPVEFVNQKAIFTKSQKFSDIQDALMFVSSSVYGQNTALLNKSTWKIFFNSESGDLDDMDEFAEEQYDPTIHIEIPHKNELGLGQNLVFKFVDQFIPDDAIKVDKIFKKRGAYSQFKDFLESKGILQKWYDYEQQCEQLAILQWCEENNIDISD